MSYLGMRIASVLLLAVGAGTGVASALQRAPELTPDQAAAVRAGVQAMLDSYRELGAAGRWEALLRLYADDARFRWVANGVVEARSVEEIRKHFLALPPGARVETTYQDTEITPLAPGIAQVLTHFETRLVDAKGGGFGFGGVLAMTLVDRGDGWKILNGHSSSPSRRQP
jgi:muconolactone delta-isomerase